MRGNDDQRVLGKLWERFASHRLRATLLIAIGIMSFWRGAWGLQDVYLFPGRSH